MGLSRLTLVAAVAASLVAAAPAAAMTGLGVAPALHRTVTVTIAATGSKADKTRTCQAGSTKQGAAAKPKAIVSARDYPVVACEQPPRSHVQLPDTLKQAAANVLATIG